MEPKESGLMRGRFERPKKWIVDELMAKRIFFMALPMAVGTLFIFRYYIADDMTKAWTMSLTVLAVFQWLNAWNCRSESRSILQMNPLSNKFLIVATVIVMLLQLSALHTPIFAGNITHGTTVGFRVAYRHSGRRIDYRRGGDQKFFYRRKLV